MNYDFYAEFWEIQKLMNEFNRHFKQEWSDVRDNMNIKWEKKTIDLCKNLKSEISPFHTLVTEFLGDDHINISPYQSLQEVLQQFVIVQKHDLIDQIHEILRDSKTGIRNYHEKDGRNPVNKLDLSENPKKAYERIVHPRKDKWLEFPREIFELMEFLDIKPSEKEIPDITLLPFYSFFLSITFTLRKPYISRDDGEFYIHDNPVSKEKVFKVPYIRASSWKGNLRWAAYRKLVDKLNLLTDEQRMKKRLILAQIFGNEKDNLENYLNNLFGELNENYVKKLREIYKKKKEEEVSFQGRLRFYPTFFDRIGLDIINPHDRETGTGTIPITLEVVPENTEGTFSLLYVPLDLIGTKAKLGKQILGDLKIITEAIRDMLTIYGFSARKTSGYGVINAEFVKGFFDVKGIELKEKEFKGFDGLESLVNIAIEKLEGKNGEK